MIWRSCLFFLSSVAPMRLGQSTGVCSLWTQTASTRAISKNLSPCRSQRMVRGSLLGLTSALLWALPGASLPQDGTVSSGQVEIQQPNAERLNIVQTSERAVINWNSFNIGASEWVNFQQPSATSATLNRVTGGFTSEIAGRLTANGQLYLVNPNGILFTPTAQINVGNFLATTLDIQNTDFMQGQLRFRQTPGMSLSTVENEGNITVAEGGFAALVAPGVANRGVINAYLGSVVLGSGTEATLDFYGDGLFSFAVDPTLTGQVFGSTGQPLNALVSNSGIISADGGVVRLSAQAGASVVNNVINMDGVILARTAENRLGTVVLSGGNTGTVAVSGTVDVSGQAAGQMGGTINVLGNQVNLIGQAQLLASGDSGGGTVLVGGDYQGQGEVPTSKTTTVGESVEIKADALTNGKGGKVIVWADGVTTMNGRISAKGGATAGAGGFVETSGKGGLSIASTAAVNVGAINGLTGTWLLDPDRLFIDSSNNNENTLPAPLMGDYFVASSVVEDALNTGNVTLAANDLIQVNTAINTSTQNNSNALTFGDQNADNNLVINLNAPIVLGQYQFLTGEGTTVNVNQAAPGILQNGVDVAASGATVNVASGTFTGTGGQVVNINKNLTVRGQGAERTIIDGESARRVFNITGNTVNLIGLKITNGKTSSYGGGIYADSGSNLTITSSIISNNSADYDGGGIYSSDGSAYGESGYSNNLTIIDSTISGNTAIYGGGIYSSGSYYGDGNFQNNLTIVNSTISGNSATGGSGGGIYSYGDSSGNGGFQNELTITNSTISGNSSTSGGGGIYSYSYGYRNSEGNVSYINGNLSVSNSIFSDNLVTSGSGGAINNSGSNLKISSSTISGNLATGGSGGGIYSSTYYSQSRDSNRGLAISGSTFSRNKATYSGGGLYYDDYSFNDSGVFSSNSTIANSTFSDNEAGYLGGGIYYGGTYYSDFADIDSLKISNSLIVDNKAGESGGGIYSYGNLLFVDSTVSRNIATSGYGGGIYNFSLFNNEGNLGIENSTVSANSAALDGGGIYNFGSLSLNNSTISNNSAGNANSSGSGGGIYNNTYYYFDEQNLGTFLVTNSTISGNSASLDGGGIYNFSYSYNSIPSTFLLANSTISGNTAEENGGGIYNAGVAQFNHSTIAENLAGVSGGGIFNSEYFSSEILSIGNSIVAGNLAPKDSEISGASSENFLSNGFNLVGQNGNAGGFGVSGTDIILAGSIDTAISPLADNGGSTLTHALVSGSPAINTAGSSSLNTDQRGLRRPIGTVNDIGAFESQESETPTPPPTPEPTPPPTPEPTPPPTPEPTPPPTPEPTPPPTSTIQENNDSSTVSNNLTNTESENSQGEPRTTFPPLSPSIAQPNEPLLASAPVQELDQHFSASVTGYLGLKNTPIDTIDVAQNTLSRISAQVAGVTPSLIYTYFAPAPKAQTAAKQSPTIIASAEPLAGLLAQASETKADKCLSQKPARPTDPIWQFDSCGWDRIFPKGAAGNENDQLVLVLVTSDGKVIRKQIADATRGKMVKAVRRFQGSLQGLRDANTYLPQAQQLYSWLVAPLEESLKAAKVNNLVFIMDKGLRALPLAALHDGTGFIVESYSVGVMPSLTLTDTRHVSLQQTQVLAMGASEFKDLAALPAVPLELSTIGKLWSGQTLLNETFTPQKLTQLRSSKPYGIVHLATHGEFQAGNAEQSYIQFWDTKVNLKQMQSLNLTQPSPVSLLVLSACRTALGDQDAELGFTGLAVSAGVQTALGGLWNISDLGTLALMSSFYGNLKTAPIKAEALRLAQVAMLKGQVRVENNQLITAGLNIPLSSKLQEQGDANLAHPYYWSGITMVGNPW